MWRLGRYRVEDAPFAAGATAEVFAARRGRAGPRVAIKVLPLKTYRDRAETEADFATIDHPRLLGAHDRVVDERRGVIGLVMDLADGDLRRALRSGDEPTAVEMLRIADDVLDALEALHGAGLVHRDVKPENVMLQRVDGELRARLGDLGIARAMDRTRTTGTVLGTDLYIAPEVHDGQPPSAAADLWAVGYVLYEGLFGAPPHANAATTYQAIGRLRAEGPDRPPGVPDSVWAVVAQLLAPDPVDRPPTAREARAVVATARAAAELASFARPGCDAPVTRKRSAGYRRAVPALRPDRRRRWTRGVVALASVVVVLGGAAWGPGDLLGDADPRAGATLSVTPLSANAADIVPTQYQWALQDGVLRGRLDVTNSSASPSRATTMPELFPREAVRDGRLPLLDFDGVQERQDDGSVLVRFAVPALPPRAHHVVRFRLALGHGIDEDRSRLGELVREREAAINRHAFSLSDAPTLERLALTVTPASLSVGGAALLTVSGTTHDGEPAPPELLAGIRYEVVSGADVVRLDGSTVRALTPGAAVLRAVVGVIHGDAAIEVARPTASPTTTARRPPVTRRPPATSPPAPSQQPPTTDPLEEEESVVV